MRMTGHRKIRPISIQASAALLEEGSLFNDELHKLPTGNTTFIPKGVYRYTSHEQANYHWMECVAKGMAKCSVMAITERLIQYR